MVKKRTKINGHELHCTEEIVLVDIEYTRDIFGELVVLQDKKIQVTLKNVKDGPYIDKNEIHKLQLKTPIKIYQNNLEKNLIEYSSMEDNDDFYALNIEGKLITMYYDNDQCFYVFQEI